MLYEIIRADGQLSTSPLANQGCVEVNTGCSNALCGSINICLNIFCGGDGGGGGGGGSDLVVVFPVCAPPINHCPGTGPSLTCDVAGPQAIG